MELLNEHAEFIASKVPMNNILGELLDANLISCVDYDRLMLEMECSCEPFVRNQIMVNCLVATLKEYKDDGAAVYFIFDYIRRHYPWVALDLPWIALGVRFRRFLGTDKVVQLTRCGGELMVHIRQHEVISMQNWQKKNFFLFFCFCLQQYMSSM
jgi:hypothetical protein